MKSTTEIAKRPYPIFIVMQPVIGNYHHTLPVEILNYGEIDAVLF